MTTQQIKAIQSRIGTVPDGFWGPKSVAACQRHLRAMMPKPHPFPATDQASLTRFYGAAGDESQLVNCDVAGLGVEYALLPVRSIRIHAKLSASLRRIIEAIAASDHAHILKLYAGSYNNRPMRGGSLPSLHARGAAIDLAQATNRNHAHWPTRATMPLEVQEIFAREGWLSAATFWSRDAMHHQATQ
jgi:hypothetical protein